MKKRFSLIAALLCLILWGCGGAQNEEPAHQHTFEEWRMFRVPSCRQEGLELRTCTECKYEETRSIEKRPHTYSSGRNICNACRYVNMDENVTVVEMGNTAPYEPGNIANYVWDVRIWDGKIYRGAGDYDKNSGDTPFIFFDLESCRWLALDTATDEAIHRFVEIDGKLYAPGIDSRDSGGWDMGNYYVLENDRWQKVRNVPDGIHCFDMIGFDGKMFIGVGTGDSQRVIGVSSDKGQTWNYLPMYKDGQLLDASTHDQGWSRCYEFAEFGGKLYAMVYFGLKAGGSTREIFVYEDGKMVYCGDGRFGGRVSRNYWQSKFEFNGKCFLTGNGLYAVTDFAKPETHKKIEMPNKEMVSDAIVYNNEMYVLSCLFNEDYTIKTVIYKSATGEEGSFTEVVSYDYGARPYSFDFDGSYFYIGTGGVLSTEYNNKAGMMLRVNPAA